MGDGLLLLNAKGTDRKCCFYRSHGVELISQEGVPFDPSLHEAVMRALAPQDVADGAVMRVLRKGYRLGGKLIRAALVIVAYRD